MERDTKQCSLDAIAELRNRQWFAEVIISDRILYTYISAKCVSLFTSHRLTSFYRLLLFCNKTVDYFVKTPFIMSHCSTNIGATNRATHIHSARPNDNDRLSKALRLIPVKLFLKEFQFELRIENRFQLSVFRFSIRITVAIRMKNKHRRSHCISTMRKTIFLQRIGENNVRGGGTREYRSGDETMLFRQGNK